MFGPILLAMISCNPGRWRQLDYCHREYTRVFANEVRVLERRYRPHLAGLMGQAERFTFIGTTIAIVILSVTRFGGEAHAFGR